MKPDYFKSEYSFPRQSAISVPRWVTMGGKKLAVETTMHGATIEGLRQLGAT